MQLSCNGITLEVEDHGSPQGEPILLIMGLGMQLLAWHEGFVASLVSRGHRVIRFDNRDAGLSQGFDELGAPNLMMASLRYALHLPMRSPYTLADMAADSVGVLDALGVRRAHVCGASMGGMIAQQMAFRHADRVASLTLMMTSSGSRRLPGPSARVRRAMLSQPRDPHDVASVVNHLWRLLRLIGSPGFPADEAEMSTQLERAVRRANRPNGVARQLLAIVADGDRSALLAAIRAPTQIIHGLQDPLVLAAAGRDLARLVPGARLDLIEGMGHDLPPALWPRFVADICDAAGRA